MEYSQAGDSALTDPAYTSDPGLAVPRPLQIIKRMGALPDFGNREPSDGSGYSTWTQGSRGSAPARPEDTFPLVIPKKRQVARTPILARPTQPTEHQRPQGEASPPGPHSDQETTPKPRRSTSCESPSRALPDLLTVGPALSAKASLLFLKGQRPEVSHLDGWKLPSLAASSRASASDFDMSDQHGVAELSTGAYLLLAPKITVTPERRALDDGVTTL